MNVEEELRKAFERSAGKPSVVLCEHLDLDAAATFFQAHLAHIWSGPESAFMKATKHFLLNMVVTSYSLRDSCPDSVHRMVLLELSRKQLVVLIKDGTPPACAFGGTEWFPPENAGIKAPSLTFRFRVLETVGRNCVADVRLVLPSKMESLFPDKAEWARVQREIKAGNYGMTGGGKVYDAADRSPMGINLCEGCRARERKNGGGPLNRCKACLLAQYCSKDCQVRMWHSHKQKCRDFQEVRKVYADKAALHAAALAKEEGTS